MRSLMFLVPAVLAGCSTTPTNWYRVDGRPIADQQMAVDSAACRGQAQAAGLAGSRENAITFNARGIGTTRGDAMVDVFNGCMADRGYLSVTR